jgi:hypothetical protein
MFAPVIAVYAYHWLLLFSGLAPGLDDVVKKAVLPFVMCGVLIALLLEESGQLGPLRIKWAALASLSIVAKLMRPHSRTA